MADRCDHLGTIETPRPPTRSTASVCEDCIVEGTQWVHLRACATCGGIRCCDSSPRRHASAHAAGGEHPIAYSIEPGEYWAWCYVDEIGFELAGGT